MLTILILIIVWKKTCTNQAKHITLLEPCYLEAGAHQLCPLRFIPAWFFVMTLLYPFLFNLFKNFLNKFLEGMEDQLNKAKEMAAEYSKDVAQKLQERAPRVSLNVKMKAPVIIVPQNSKSSNALVADFGSLSVGNSFSKAGESEKKTPYVLDKMVVELTSLKMSRYEYVTFKV